MALTPADNHERPLLVDHIPYGSIPFRNQPPEPRQFTRLILWGYRDPNGLERVAHAWTYGLGRDSSAITHRDHRRLDVHIEPDTLDAIPTQDDADAIVAAANAARANQPERPGETRERHGDYLVVTRWEQHQRVSDNFLFLEPYQDLYPRGSLFDWDTRLTRPRFRFAGAEAAAHAFFRGRELVRLDLLIAKAGPVPATLAGLASAPNTGDDSWHYYRGVPLDRPVVAEMLRGQYDTIAARLDDPDYRDDGPLTLDQWWNPAAMTGGAS